MKTEHIIKSIGITAVISSAVYFGCYVKANEFPVKTKTVNNANLYSNYRQYHR